MKKYFVAEFAKLIGVAPQTLRNWDKTGVYTANRFPSGYRFYTHEHIKEMCDMGLLDANDFHDTLLKYNEVSIDDTGTNISEGRQGT